jgi:hypothetical protein
MFRWFLHSLPRSVRGLVARRYRPELYYMRGSGPACAARRANQQSFGPIV